jgi:hypothetical protein
MFRTARETAKLRQGEAYLKTGIALKPLQGIENGVELPLPGEIKLLDQCYQAGGMLVLRYCGTRCPDGQYAGLQFEDISPQSAGIKLITSLAGIEKILPEIADIVCEVCDGVYKPENQERYRNICRLLSQLRRYIMSIEVLMVNEKLPQQRELKSVREFAISIKEKTACKAMQTVVG